MEKPKEIKCHECGKKMLHIDLDNMDKGFHFCSHECVKKSYFERGIEEDPLSP